MPQQGLLSGFLSKHGWAFDLEANFLNILINQIRHVLHVSRVLAVSFTFFRIYRALQSDGG